MKTIKEVAKEIRSKVEEAFRTVRGQDFDQHFNKLMDEFEEDLVASADNEASRRASLYFRIMDDLSIFHKEKEIERDDKPE